MVFRRGKTNAEVASDEEMPDARRHAAKRKTRSDDAHVVSSGSEDEKTRKPSRRKAGKMASARTSSQLSQQSKLAIDDDDDDDDSEESTEETKRGTRNGKKGGRNGKSKEEDVIEVEDDDDEEEEEEEEEDDLEYVIERILKHKTVGDGTTYYLIRWEGYSEADDTWEPEGNCNATQLLADYWKEFPTHKQPRKMQNLRKKLEKIKSPRKSTNGKVSPPQDDDDEEEADEEEQRAKFGSSKNKSISGESADVDEVATALSEPDGSRARKESSLDELNEAEKHKQVREREMRHAAEMLVKWEKHRGSWDEVVETVQSMAKEDDGTIRVQVLFDNGDEFWMDKKLAYEKLPQAMLQFYESRLKFKTDS